MYRCAHTYFRDGWERSLHRQIWRDANGPIPAGHHIHHKDGDPLNNAIENLACLTSTEHRHHHNVILSEEEKADFKRRMELARPAALAWHRSEEGKAWHAHMGKAAWLNVKPKQHVCEQCGKTYESTSVSGSNRFCGYLCAARFRRASGVNDVECVCENCGKKFNGNRFEKRRFCSKSCVQLKRWKSGPAEFGRKTG